MSCSLKGMGYRSNTLKKYEGGKVQQIVAVSTYQPYSKSESFFFPEGWRGREGGGGGGGSLSLQFHLSLVKKILGKPQGNSNQW